MINIKPSGRISAKTLFGKKIELKSFGPYELQKYYPDTLSIAAEVKVRMAQNRLTYEKNGIEMSSIAAKELELSECRDVVSNIVFSKSLIFPSRDSVRAAFCREIIADIDTFGGISPQDFAAILKIETRPAKIFGRSLLMICLCIKFLLFVIMVMFLFFSAPLDIQVILIIATIIAFISSAI